MHENQEEEECRLLIEMHPNLPEGYDCVLAPMIVDVPTSMTVPVYLFNPHSYPIVVREVSVVGQVEPMNVESTISRYGNPNEGGKFSAPRRVLLKGSLSYPIKLAG